ncbi:hypothetical protein [Romboutsia ilealis]|uniref:hypothetical protein n=1 Tax=Romboutsia ilealis TaxID=1115758 RepID=UPI00272A98DC|nr:hypothetical protein [Romboutsia ilealis]
MDTVKNITTSLLILVGFIFIINASKCFMTIDGSIRVYIIRYGISGLLMIGIGILVKEYM